MSPEAEAVARDLEGGTFSDAAKEEGHWVRTDSGQWVAAPEERSPPRSPPRVPDLEQTASNSPMEMATPRGDADNSLEAARAAAVVAAATPMPAPPVQRRRSVEPCLAELIDGLKLKPAQAESLEQLLDEHEVHDLATAQILDAEDFKEIGIKVGTRKKLLERLASSTSEA